MVKFGLKWVKFALLSQIMLCRDYALFLTFFLKIDIILSNIRHYLCNFGGHYLSNFQITGLYLLIPLFIHTHYSGITIGIQNHNTLVKKYDIFLLFDVVHAHWQIKAHGQWISLMKHHLQFDCSTTNLQLYGRCEIITAIISSLIVRQWWQDLFYSSIELHIRREETQPFIG